MKRYVVALAALLMVTGYALAADMSAQSDPGMANQNLITKDYVVMNDGVMMVVKNGMKMMMDTDMTMTNGTIVKKTGTYTLKDGTKMILREGDKMDLDGNMIIDNKTPIPLPAY
jgi:hypothetical protein